VAGNTQSTDFPTTAGARRTTYIGGFSDVFVAKLDATGSTLVYSRYLGSRDREFAYGIAVDANGEAYVTESTSSTDFPTTAGAAQIVNAGGLDAFVTKLDSTGSTVVYSTYLGGSGDDADLRVDITVDGAGEAYVTGRTESTDFPTTTGAVQTVNAGGADAFVARLDASGSTLAYSTYLGGSGDEAGSGIAVDAAGGIYVAGETSSTDFPATKAAVQPAPAGGVLDAFVAKIESSAPVVLPSVTISP
jgi:hypothetical protein